MSIPSKEIEIDPPWRSSLPEFPRAVFATCVNLEGTSHVNASTTYMGLRDKDQPREAEPALPPPLVRLNHVSFSCASLEESVGFYRRVLGFELVQRPASFDFKGAWMHKYGMGIHLLQRSSDCDVVPPVRPPAMIDPKGNHISFQCSDMALMKARLSDMNLELVTTKVWDGETAVEQLFFHDPDGNMIEICNCENLPVVPLPAAASSCFTNSQCR